MSYGRRRSVPWTHPGTALLAGLLLLPPLAQGSPARLVVTVTAYASGMRTAAGVRPRGGIVAVSRDVERQLGLRFGDVVEVSGVGRLIFRDRMPARWTRRIDVYLPTRAAAVQFGRRTGWLRRCP